MSTEEDRQILELVRNWKPSEELHASARLAWILYEHGQKSVNDFMVEELHKVLSAYGDDLVGLARAMEGLIRFNVFLRTHEKDDPGADRVLGILQEFMPLFEPLWERVAEALQNVGESDRASFQHFMASEGGLARTAPPQDARRPEGTVPLKNLVHPHRPPPWAQGKKSS